MSLLFTCDELAAAATLVHRQISPSPQIAWPLLSEATGADVIIKHENHLPTGAFKVRGGITYVDWLRRTQPTMPGLCTATRGNHGQSQARAATAAGLRALVYVPRGNSREKNAAMRSYGAELVEFGQDFDTAREEAYRTAARDGLAIVPPFHHELLRGVATGGLELLTACPDLHTVYVPIGAGSGIVGMIAARDALGLSTRIVGVVAEGAATVKLSLEAGRPVPTERAETIADGLAVRVPVPEALTLIASGADRIVSVTDEDIARAMRLYFRTIHAVAEGAGAAALAALLTEREKMAGRRVGLVLSGGNVDSDRFATILQGGLPPP